MDSWRRGKEAPMQWEYTSPTRQASTSQSLFAQENAATTHTADVSMPDISMVDDEGQEAAPVNQEDLSAEAVEEIKREDNTAKELIHRSPDSQMVHPWPIPPMVGTVINYLVPPVQPPSQPQPQPQQQQHHSAASSSSSSLASRRAHATLHPRERPLLLLSYAQLAFNAIMLLLGLYIILAIVWTIRLDILERFKEIEDAHYDEINSCKRSYELNCLLVPLPPVLEKSCENWKICSSKSAHDSVLNGSRLRVVIEILSEAVEIGIGALGWRTLLFGLCALSIFMGANSTLNGLRKGITRKSRRRRQQQLIQQEEDDEDDDEDNHRQPLYTSHNTPYYIQSPPQPHHYPHPHYHPVTMPASSSSNTRRSKRIANSSHTSKGLKTRSHNGNAADSEWIELSD
ncbi:unnamed protein product [Sympodiomycopsis kandeliae]